MKAINETDAYDLGLDVWDSESMIGQQPNDVLVNWYVAPLPDAKDLHDDVAAMIAAFESRRASINND